MRLRRKLFRRASARREVWQYHFLCLSACETAPNTSVKASLIFTEPSASCADSTLMVAASNTLKGRRQQSATSPHILQERFLSASAKTLKHADKERHKFRNIPQPLPGVYVLISVP